MGRNRKNESSEWGVSDKRPNYSGNRIMSLVEIPFYNKVTYKIKTGEDNDGKPMYATTQTEPINEFLQTKEETTKELEKQSHLGVNYKVISFEPVKLLMPNECPKCHEVGFPNIDRVPNHMDYHPRANNRTFKFPTDRPDSYSLTFSHKIADKVKKCAISRLDKRFLNFLKDSRFDTKMIEYIFPYFLKPIKNI